MDNEQIARILYNMCLDMDWGDYIEESEIEIKAIENELHVLGILEMPYLKKVLETIAQQNEDIENWKESQITE